jgi:drug/metabolite transporter (DMT)-like permease
VLQSGILLAVGSAFLCGCAGICASQGAKRLGALTTTFLALLIGAPAFERLGLTAQVFVWSMPMGVFAGAMTAIGYSSGYRGMSLGPLAIVSPIVATDGAIAGSLAMLLQHERVDGWQMGILAAIFLGVLLACTSVRELSLLLHPAQRKAALSLRGVHWGVLAALAFDDALHARSRGAVMGLVPLAILVPLLRSRRPGCDRRAEVVPGVAQTAARGQGAAGRWDPTAGRPVPGAGRGVM